MFNIDFSKLSTSELKKYTKYIVGVAVVLIAVAGYFLWWPKYQEFRDSRIQLETENERINKKQEYLLELERNLDNLKNYDEELLKIGTALPLEYEGAALASFIQRMVSQSQLIMTGVGISDKDVPSSAGAGGGIKLKAISMGTKTRGEYSSFKDFISRLYTSSRLIDIQSISISVFEDVNATGPQSDVYEFQVNLDAKYYNQE